MFADDFPESVHSGSSRTLAVVWSEGHDGLQGFLEAILDRQIDGKGGGSWGTQAGCRSSAGPGGARAGWPINSRRRASAAHTAARRNEAAHGRIHPREVAWGAKAPGCSGERTWPS